MPSFADLSRRFPTLGQDFVKVREGGEEVLVADQRANLSPTQRVEQKLRAALHRRDRSLTTSSLQRRTKPR